MVILLCLIIYIFLALSIDGGDVLAWWLLIGIIVSGAVGIIVTKDERDEKWRKINEKMDEYERKQGWK